MNNPVRRASMRLEAKKLRKMSPAQSFERVLEIGCSEGQGTKNILRYWKPRAIYAIDLDPKMIARAKRCLADKRVLFAVGDAAKLTKAAFEAELTRLGFDAVSANEFVSVHMFWKVLRKS